MNFRKAALTVSLFALASSAGTIAAADDSGWYTGFSAGQSRAKIDDTKIAAGLLSEGFTTTSISNDDRHFGFKAFGGYQVDKYFALESGYFDLGEFGFLADTRPVGALNGTIKIKGLNFDAVGSLPITSKFSAFARAGFIYAQAKDSFSGSGLVTVTDPRPSKRDPNYKFGAGLQYDFTQAFGLRLEAERYRVDDALGNKGEIDLYSAGLLYRFGRAAQSPAPVAPPPPVVAAAPVAPPPTPPPAPPPPPPKPRRVTFSADSLFDFGKASVKPAGKQSLDQLAGDLKGAQFTVITVIGYSDRIGAQAYNQKLSTRRAEAVRDYLVESLGIPSSKTEVKGMDGADPVTKPNECVGQKRTPQLIACLQPDRRVEVEVSGTK
jgi:OmpA-OmpF porin, OOP family